MKTAIAVMSLLLCLLLPAAQPAGAYEYHMPVNIEYTMTPSVLLPGDEAMLSIEMANGAASYGAGEDAGARTYSQGTVLSTPLNHTTLHSTAEIEVLEEDHTDLGMIGPTDRITVYYKIRARENITSGTHLLNFEVAGGYDMTTLHREIPIKVDGTAVSLARAETSATSFNLNVANPRENTLNAVTIVPSAVGMAFSPDEYYIGTMDPDEVFTISFSLVSALGDAVKAKPVNMSFAAQYKNGEEWHVSEPFNTTYQPPVEQAQQSSYLLPAGAVLIVLLAAGAWMYRKRKKGRAAGIAAGIK